MIRNWYLKNSSDECSLLSDRTAPLRLRWIPQPTQTSFQRECMERQSTRVEKSALLTPTSQSDASLSFRRVNRILFRGVVFPGIRVSGTADIDDCFHLQEDHIVLKEETCKLPRIQYEYSVRSQPRSGRCSTAKPSAGREN